MNVSENIENFDGGVNLSRFNAAEYTTFASLLGISALVGMYYGCFKRDQNSVSEYIHGSKQMKVLPIALSFVASHVSGITLLGAPSEVYEFGTQYLTVVISTTLVSWFTIVFVLPVLYDLQITSLYEYLEMRFSSNVRKLASFIYLVHVLLYIPVVIYIPALAFNQVTGVSVHLVTSVVCFICIFYTTFGGLKAVVWTDALQSVFTAFAFLTVSGMGIYAVGGVGNLLEISEKGSRIEIFNLNPDPFARNTFWTVTIGSFFLWATSFSFHPGTCQRFVSLPTINDAKWSVIYFGMGVAIVKILSVFVGLLMYAKYYSCDPFRSMKIAKIGAILPYYVQDVAASFMGLTGLFVSGLVSAALSTMSANINTLAGTLYEDFIGVYFISKKNDKMASFIMKIIVAVVGVLCVAMVFIIEKLGAILQVATSLHGITNGGLFAVFALGMFFPWVNERGAMVGLLASVITMAVIVTGGQWAVSVKSLYFAGKPLDVSGCPANTSIYNITVPENLREYSEGVYAAEDLNPIYRLSYMYYSALGSAIGITVALIVSLLSGGNDLRKLDAKLLTPAVRRFLPKNKNKEMIIINGKATNNKNIKIFNKEEYVELKAVVENVPVLSKP